MTAPELAENPFGEEPAPKGAPAPKPAAEPKPQAAPAAQGGTVTVIDEYGQPGLANASDLAAIEAGGGRLATPEEARKAQLEAKHGGVAGTLAAAGEGFARGISVGLSDPLAVGAARLFGGDKAAEATRQHLAEEKEIHPLASTAAEVTGAIAPVIASGGAAAPEEAGALGLRGGAEALGAASREGVMAGIGQGVRTLGVLPRGIAAMGEAAEHAVAGVLGSTAESAIGRAAQSAAKTATNAIVQGGLFGAGQGISEGTLDNDLTAEKVFATVGHSALLAGLLGGGLAGVGSLAGDAVSGILGKSGKTLEDAASDQAFASLDAKGANEAAIKRAGGRTELGKAYMDEVIRPAVESEGITAAALTNDAKLERVNKVLDDISEQAKAKLAGSTADVAIKDVLKPFDERIAEFRGKLGQTAVADRMQSLRDEAQRILLPGLKEGEAVGEQRVAIADLYAQKQSLQAAAYRAAKTMNPAEPVQQMREVSGAFNGLIEEAMNKASKETGGIEGTELRALNKRMQRMMTIQDILEHNQVRYARNDTVSLTSKMAGFSEAAGAIAAGHPLAALGAPFVSAATEAVKYHGNAYAALMLDRLAKFGGISKAASEFDEQVGKAVDTALSGKPSKGVLRAARGVAEDVVDATARKAGGKTSDKRYQQEEARVRQLAAMAPAIIAEHLQDRTAPLSTHMPKVAASMQRMAVEQTRYLASKLPKHPAGTVPSLTPQLDKPKPSAADRTDFLRAVDAVEDGPPGIMKRVAKGTITKQDVEVMRQFYPKSLEEAQHLIVAKCADRTKPLNYQTQLRLGTLFGVPTTPTLEPAFLSKVDASFAVHPQAPNSNGPAQPPRHASMPAQLSIAKATASQFEQARGA